MPKHDLYQYEKLDFEDIVSGYELEIKNLKEQISQLKNFGIEQVKQNNKQGLQIRELVNENEKLDKYIFNLELKFQHLM
jgi:hypothetical protein